LRRLKTLLAAACLMVGMLASVSGVQAASKADLDDPGYYKHHGLGGGEAIPDETRTRGAVTPYAAGEKNPYTGLVYTHDPRKNGTRVVYGVDVSRWQGDKIDWKKVKAAGIEYAFIRAGYSSLSSGAHLKDTCFDVNMKNARAAGIKVGVYYYSQATTAEEARSEASYLLELLKGYTLDYPVVFDAEEGTYTSDGKTVLGKLAAASKKLSTADRIAMYNTTAMAFCDVIRGAGYTPMIYGSISHFRDKMDSAALSNKYLMWIARYNTVLNNSSFTYNGNYQFWQYTDKGKVNGISGNVDCNFLYLSGNEDESWKQGGGSTVPDTPLPTTPPADPTPSNTAVGGISGFTAKASGTGTIKLSWSVNAQAASYDVYRADAFSGKYKKIATVSQASYSDKSCGEGREYYYYVMPVGSNGTEGKKSSVKRAYTSSSTKVYVKVSTSLNMRTEADTGSSVVTVVPKNKKVYRYCETRSSDGVVWYKVKYTKSGKTYKGYISSRYATVAVNKLSGVKQSAKAKTSLTISWAKQSGVTAYQVYRATARNGKYKKVATIKDINKKSYKDTGLKANREYWYKVRAYSKVNGKFTYGTQVLLRATTKTSSSKVKAKSAAKLYQYAGTAYKKMVSVPKNAKMTVLNTALDKKGATWYRVKYKKGKKTYNAYIKKSLTKKA
jgi:GH25 family lysozyme M1 (1,4-beta-N-acetylmuramidase)